MRREIGCDEIDEQLMLSIDTRRTTHSQEIADETDGLSFENANGNNPGEFPTTQVEIDNYQLLDVIGRGGMGVVWRAKQLHPIQRLVAIKILKGELADAKFLKRFVVERQALAKINHPDIANVLDAGITSNGLPFIVMDLADGVPLDDYCDSNRLSVFQRIELIERIARAMNHFHDMGIVHRDLKPSNILVSGEPKDPQLKIIDFGIAKLVASNTQLATQTGELLGTPEFMSPEQATLSKQNVDRRSDVYSLGTMLYQAITGSTPLSASGVDADTSVHALLYAIMHIDPPRPSRCLRSKNDLPYFASRRATTTKYLLRHVQGDLDWIVLKSLQKQPEDRYPNAAEFADDLERFTNMQPIVARPPTPVYRFKKLFQRRKAVAILSAILVATIFLFVAIAISFQHFQQVKRQQQIAQDNLQITQDMRHVIKELSTIATWQTPVGGLSEKQRKLAEEVWGQTSIAIAESKTRSQNVPSTSDCHEWLNRAQAKLHAQLAGQRLVDDLQAALGTAMTYDFRTEDYRYQEAISEVESAFFEYGIDPYTDDPDDIARELRQLPDIFEPDIIRAIDLWLAYDLILMMQTKSGLTKKWTLQSIKDGRDTRRLSCWLAIANRYDDDPWRTQMRLAMADLDPERLEKLALKQLNELAEHPPVTITAYAIALHTVGQADLAVEQLELAFLNYCDDGWIAANLGRYYLRTKGEYLSAAGYLRSAVALRPADIDLKVSLAEALHCSGLSSQSLQLIQGIVESHPHHDRAQMIWAVSLEANGQRKKGISILEKLAKPNDSIVARCYLASMLFRDQQFKEARDTLAPFFDSSWKFASDHVDSRYEKVIVCTMQQVLLKLKKKEEARDVLHHALAAFPDDIEVLLRHGTLLFELGQCDDAIDYLVKAQKQAPNHFDTNRIVAMAFTRKGQFKESIPYYEAALRAQPNDTIVLAGLRYARFQNGSRGLFSFANGFVMSFFIDQ